MKHSICEGDYINSFDAFVSKYKAKILTAKINNESLQPKGLYCKSDFFFTVPYFLLEIELVFRVKTCSEESSVLKIN